MKSSAKKQQGKPTVVKKTAMPLQRVNYILIALGTLVIAASFGIMFLEKDVDGVFALFVSPVTLTAAYAGIAFAILYRPKPKKSAS
ncbi:MAG: hypothetical protein HGB23_03900 [Chlorobiaceae bacterium]|nr:hypothetical protein [Chlorobiaceae bacterium]